MKLNLYDNSLNRIAIIGDQYISCLWSEGYNTVENFTVELVATQEYKQKAKVDCYVGRDDRKTLMVIKTVQIANGKIVASGKQATRVLSDVSFIGTIEPGSVIDSTIKNAYNNSTKYNNVEIVDSGIEARYQHQISNKSFLDLLQTMCQSEDVGFRAVRENGVIKIELYQPQENKNLVFSEKFGNLSIDSFSTSVENYKNYAIVLGALTGETRKIVYVDRTNGEQKKELIVDARDIQKADGESESSYELKLVERGTEKLNERTETLACVFEPYSADFPAKYDLGDVLTVYLSDYGLTLKSRVSKFTQKSQNNKTITTIAVGQITIKR